MDSQYRSVSFDLKKKKESRRDESKRKVTQPKETESPIQSSNRPPTTSVLSTEMPDLLHQDVFVLEHENVMIPFSRLDDTQLLSSLDFSNFLEECTKQL